MISERDDVRKVGRRGDKRGEGFSPKKKKKKKKRWGKFQRNMKKNIKKREREGVNNREKLCNNCVCIF